jgi:hypothetical protein
VLAQLVRRLQRELVERKRPDRRRREGERDALAAVRKDVGDQRAQLRRGIAGDAERERAGERLDAPGARREREDVVAQATAVSSTSSAPWC